MLTGRDAEPALDWICAGDISRPPGTLTYTQLLNARGGIECDLTVARLADDALLHRHRHRLRHPRFRLDRPQLPRRAPTPASPTSPRSTPPSPLMGPKSREILAPLTDGDLSNASLPLRHRPPPLHRRRPGHRPARHLRRRARLGAPHPRRVRRHRLRRPSPPTPRHRRRLPRHRDPPPRERLPRLGPPRSAPTIPRSMAGLGFATKLRSNIPFLGRDALEAQRTRPLPASSPASPSPTRTWLLLGRETLYRNGRRVGWLASGGWGYTRRPDLGYGYVRDPEHGLTPRTSSLAATSSRSPPSASRPGSSSSRPYDPSRPNQGLPAAPAGSGPPARQRAADDRPAAALDAWRLRSRACRVHHAISRPATLGTRARVCRAKRVSWTSRSGRNDPLLSLRGVAAATPEPVAGEGRAAEAQERQRRHESGKGLHGQAPSWFREPEA